LVDREIPTITLNRAVPGITWTLVVVKWVWSLGRCHSLPPNSGDRSTKTKRNINMQGMSHMQNESK